MSTVSVCLAEDFPLMREAMRARLASDPRIEVRRTAGDARGLLEALVLDEPDVALIDLHMPDTTGVELVQRIRRAHPGVRIAVFTATEQPGRAHAALQAGANAFLVKRQPIEQVADAICAIHDGGTVVAPGLVAALLADAPNQPGGKDAGGYRPAAMELEILRSIVRGDTDETIARTLYVSSRTVQNHLARIRRQAGVGRRTELVRWAVENGYC